MNFNILIGGAAGQGIDTIAAVIEKILKRKGFEIFTIRDYMSRVRGGHNFILIRFGDQRLYSQQDSLDGIIALDETTVYIHSGRLKNDGFIICDNGMECGDSRCIKLPLKDTAKNAGNIKSTGIAGAGAAISLFGLDLQFSEDVLNGIFDKESAGINIKSFKQGHTLTQPRYKIKPGNDKDKILISGNEAIALGALAAGCRFYSAYPMTPSTGIMNYLASKMYEAEIVVEQAEDEIAAINMAIGASYAGVRSMTGTSGGGFCLKVEALGLSSMLEVPLVIANIQRPGPVTGLPTRTEQGDLKFVISAGQGEFPRMVIAPRTPEDAFYQTVRAFNIADKYQIPVIILGDQFLADYTTTTGLFDLSRVTVERYIADDNYSPDTVYNRYEVTDSGISPRIIPSKVPGRTVLVDSDEHDTLGRITESSEVRVQMHDKRMRKTVLLSSELIEPWFIGEEDFSILLLAWGSLYGPLKEAVETLNISGKHKSGALVFGDIWPLPVKLLTSLAGKADRIINIEQNSTGQLASLIREQTGIVCSSSLLKYDGRPLSAGEIADSLRVEAGL